MRTLRWMLIASLLTAATGAAAQENPFKLEAHGFVTASMFVQDQAFPSGQGQSTLSRAPSPSAARPVGSGNGMLLGSDVKQSRLILAVTGPETLDATPRGYLETDLGTGYQDYNVRIRTAYAELRWKDTVLLAGQFSAHLTFPMLYETLAHIANPPTYGVGNIGTRATGLRVIHTLPVGSAKLELAGDVVSSRWLETSPGTDAKTVPLGWSTSRPGLGARAKAFGKAGDLGYSVSLSGYYQSVDLRGFGDTVAPNGFVTGDGGNRRVLDTVAGNVSGRFDYDRFSLLVNAFSGRNVAPIAGGFGQYGDIGTWGWWAQLGGKVTPELSLWALFGQGSSNEKDVLNWRNYPKAGTANDYSIRDNQLVGGMIRYQKRGYAIAAEYYRFDTDYLVNASGAPATWATYTAGDVHKKKMDGSQFIVTAGYFF